MKSRILSSVYTVMLGLMTALLVVPNKWHW